MSHNHRPDDRYWALSALKANASADDKKAKGPPNGSVQVPTPNPGPLPQSTPAPGDAFNAAEFDALPLPEKLHRAAHASMTWQMSLIASTDPATASDARIRAAIIAAQNLLSVKVKIDEIKFRPQAPDRSQEHLAKWARLEAEQEAEEQAKREEEEARRASGHASIKKT